MAYQIIVFEPNPQGRTDALWEILKQRFLDLNIDLEAGVSLLRDLAADVPDPKAPAAVVYFGAAQLPNADIRRCIGGLLEKSITIVPVVDDLKRYRQLVPDELHEINGFEFDTVSPNYEAIAARILEALSLLRETRRLFISYRRSDSRKVAIQLYEALDEKTFDVFLDTISIRPGEAFQKVLAHRLADVDVIVLLHTKDFIGSRWTIAELTQANAMNVAILRLEWPEITDIRNSPDPAEQEKARCLDEEAALSVPLVLAPGDFEADGRLTSSVTVRVLERVEALRARALAARQAKLTREFAEQARQHGFSVYPQPEQFVVLRKPGVSDLIVYPAVGAPSAVTYERVHDAIVAAMAATAGQGGDPAGADDSSGPDRTPELYVLYDNRALLERHLKHLAWLDAQISAVRSIPVAEASGILAEAR